MMTYMQAWCLQEQIRNEHIPGVTVTLKQYGPDRCRLWISNPAFCSQTPIHSPDAWERLHAKFPKLPVIALKCEDDHCSWDQRVRVVAVLREDDQAWHGVSDTCWPKFAWKQVAVEKEELALPPGAYTTLRPPLVISLRNGSQNTLLGLEASPKQRKLPAGYRIFASYHEFLPQGYLGGTWYFFPATGSLLTEEREKAKCCQKQSDASAFIRSFVAEEADAKVGTQEEVEHSGVCPAQVASPAREVLL